MEKLLSSIRFTGRVSIVVQNDRVLKSGYEEGYFRNQVAGVGSWVLGLKVLGLGPLASGWLGNGKTVWKS